jgi:hypothetical protein
MSHATLSASVGSFNEASRNFRGAARPQIPRFYPAPGRTTAFRLLPGDYEMQTVEQMNGELVLVTTREPFLRYTRHFDLLHRQSAQCSAGPYARYRDLRQPCDGCDLHWATLEGGKPGHSRSSRMTRTTQSAFSALHLAYYHAGGRSQGRGLTECSGPDCPACRAGVPATQGLLGVLDLGWWDFQALRAANVDVGRACLSCGGATIETLAWVCEHCGDAAVDLRDGSPKIAKRKDLLEEPFPCACGTTAMLQEIIACTACTPAGREPRRASLFDVDVEVTAETEAAGNTRLRVVGWTAPRAISPALLPLCIPLDLPAEFAPTPYEAQCALFRMPRAGASAPRTTAR